MLMKSDWQDANESQGMNYCFPATGNSTIFLIMMGFAVVFSAVLLAYGGQFTVMIPVEMLFLKVDISVAQMILAWGFSILVLLLGLRIMRASIASIRFGRRTYAICENGFVVGGKQKKCIPWNQVKGICISVFGGNASLSGYSNVICVFLSEETPEFKEKITRRASYAAKNADRFVVIEYKEDLFARLTEYYPGAIVDYRKEQLWRFSMH